MNWGHAFITWSTTQVSYFTELELRNFYRRFCHPHVRKLSNVLRLETEKQTPQKTFRILLEITKQCYTCQKFSHKPKRFKFTLRDEYIQFNHSIYCDILSIAKVPVLHFVYEATRFQATSRLENMSAEELWRALKSCWLDVYLGPPDIITHIADSNFIARSFQANADLLHIKCQHVPIEGANRMSLVERYHEPLRWAFNIIKTK